MPRAITIGQLARRMGVQTSAVRFYERQGLIAPGRLSNGYRVYTQNAVNALRFICRAKELGFSLEQIGEILQIRRRDAQPCAQVKELVERNLAEVERKIAELIGLRRELKALASATVRPGSSTSVCPIIEARKSDASGSSASRQETRDSRKRARSATA